MTSKWHEQEAKRTELGLHRPIICQANILLLAEKIRELKQEIADLREEMKSFWR